MEKDIVSLPVHMKDLKVPVGKRMGGFFNNTEKWDFQIGCRHGSCRSAWEPFGNLFSSCLYGHCPVPGQVSNMLERPTQPSASFGNLLVQ